MKARVAYPAYLVAIAGTLCVAGCPKKERARADGAVADAPAHATKPAPAKPAAEPASGEPASGKPAPVEPASGKPSPLEISDIAPRALAVAPAPKVMAEVARAHYDPERLGLREIDFTFRMQQKSRAGTTILEGKGQWRSGSALTTELSSVTRNGKAVPRKGGDLDERLWASHATQVQRLLHGLGAGFLRPRIDRFAEAAGKVRRIGAKLELAYEDEEAGRTLLLLGKGHRVLRQQNVAPQGVTRTMTYEHEIVGGRNLVRRAVLRVSIPKETNVPRRAAASLAYANGMTYEFRYGKVGSFHLPVRIRRWVEGTADALTIELKHKRVAP